MKQLKVLELFAGTRCVSEAFERRGHKTFSVEWNKDFENISLYADISTLTAEDIINLCGGRPDVIWASPDCFVAGTPVWTSEGYKPIEQINCKDMVLTHKGNYKRVYRTIKKSAYEFTRLKIAGAEEIMVTPNHPFYVRKKIGIGPIQLGSPEWIDAGKLTTDYRVGIPINTNSIIPKWEGCVREWHNQFGRTRSEIVNNLSPLMDNPDFWYFVGAYFGDGCLTDNTIELTYGFEESLENKIGDALGRCGIKFTKRTKSTSRSINVFDLELSEFLKRYGVGAANKSITPEILNLPIDLLKQFLIGYFDTDGHLDQSTENPRMVYTTVSRNLAYGLNLCILKAYHKYASVTRRDSSTVNNVIEGRTVKVRDAYVCGFYLNDSPRLQYSIEDGMAWVNIKQVETTRFAKDQQSIYTLSVEDDESYTVYNFCAHNCTTYSVMAISHHREREQR